MASKNKTPCPVDTGKGFSVFYRNIFLYPRTYPQERTLSLVSRIPLEENTLYLVPSPAMFYGISELQKRLPASSCLICIEFDSELYSFSRQYLPDTQITYLHAENIGQILSAFPDDLISRYRKIKQIILTGGYQLNREMYSALYDCLEDRLSIFWKNKMTMIYMSRLWINNIFLNLASLGSSSGCNIPKTGKAVLVIGAGESLEKRLSEIQDHRKKLFLLCVDTALPVLSQKNIFPDAVIAMEAQHVNLYDFLGSIRDPQISLFYDLNSFYKIPSLFHGEKVPFVSEFSRLGLFSELRENGLFPFRIPPLGSVGLAALFFGGLISSAVCGFIGLDFSYTLGKLHARGTESHKRLLLQYNKLGNADYTINSFKRNSRHYEGLGGALRSDPVLASYARQCSVLLSSGNFADCGTSGFVNHSKKMSVAELAGSADQEGNFSIADCSFSAAAAVGFLKKKEEALSAVKKVMDSSSLGMTEKVKEMLLKNDFIYADFPEPDIFILDSKIIMSRLYTSVCRYQKTIEKALVIAAQYTQKS